MNPLSNGKREAFEELPEALKTPLLSYLETRSEADLDALIQAALSDFSDVEIPKELNDGDRFVEELGLDSLTIAEFVFFFEDAFDLKISNEELVKLRTVGDLKQFISGQLTA